MLNYHRTIISVWGCLKERITTHFSVSLFVRVQLRLTHLQRELLISPPRSFIMARHLQLATRGMRVVFVTKADEAGGLMETTEKIRLSQSGQS